MEFDSGDEAELNETDSAFDIGQDWTTDVGSIRVEPFTEPSGVRHSVSDNSPVIEYFSVFLVYDFF